MLYDKDKFIEPLHCVAWNFSQSSGSLHRQKQTEYKYKENIMIINNKQGRVDFGLINLGGHQLNRTPYDDRGQKFLFCG